MGDDTKRAMLTVTDGVLGAAILLAAGVYGGTWLDQQFHTSPWLSVGLAIVGGGLGLGRMVYKANQIGKSLPEESISAKKPVHKQTAGITGEAQTGGIRHKNPFDDLDDEEN